ncbi:hypothetical protein DM01DRAFT_1159083 [Hesseltinella vesiculosa]|uniref:Uncharacterized protein n=1 Tax=Hesseltinella vesiculosa TaxID=101127 RepID=A0A1X2GSD2_9FUNG|nr:hypothetical protein DM01DRAFT_1159083 [Hesseltinella vesiculosa]
MSCTFSPQTLGVVLNKVQEAQNQMTAGTFAPPTIFIKPASRVFTLLPIPLYKPRYTKFNKDGMATLLHHYGLHHLLPARQRQASNQPPPAQGHSEAVAAAQPTSDPSPAEQTNAQSAAERPSLPEPDNVFAFIDLGKFKK